MIIKRDTELLQDLYWFWSKMCFYKKVNGQSPERIDSQFNIMLTILETKYNMRGLKEGRYNGQTKAEFDKNYQRVKDIVDKSVGDVDKAIALSQTQANRISDEFKAINRSMCAKELYNNTKNEIYMNIYESLKNIQSF